jgi:hypothetical protein
MSGSGRGRSGVFTAKGFTTDCVVTSNAMNIDPDLLGDDGCSTIGTETLLAHDMVQEGLLASSKGPAEQ